MEEVKTLVLAILPGRLAICRLDAAAPIPDWLPAAGFVSLTRTARELSLVCAQEAVPAGITAETGWRALEVAGPLDFALTGVLASLAAPPAAAGISIFAISTFDTDYILVREHSLDAAITALRAAGHTLAPR